MSSAHTAVDEAARDRVARERIAHDLDHSFLVEAAAGTGKTTMLVRRLVAVLESGQADVAGIVAVTFTRKAAGELKLRLRQALDERRTTTDDDTARNRLEEAIARLEEATIGTIHGFCAELLRQRPIEARVDPSFAESDDEESRALYRRAFRGWVEERLSDLPEGLRRALARQAGRRAQDRSSPLDRLQDAGWRLVDWRDFSTPWQRRPFDRAAEIDQLLGEVAHLTDWFEQCRDPRDYLRRALEPVARLWSWMLTSARAGGWALPGASPADRRDAATGQRDDDALEARLVRLKFELKRTKGWKGRGKLFAPGLARDEVRQRRDDFLAALDAFQARADADLAALLHRELSEVVERYEALKKRSGRLDFLDLLIRTRDVIRDQPTVRAALQERYSHLFLDEFQDTDPLQAEILLLLAADDPACDDWRLARPIPGKLFLVGDPKQSIYRFRRADVALYEVIKGRLLERGVELLHLARSFRSLRSLQQMVNAAFAPIMQGDGQPDYVPLLPGRTPAPYHARQPSLVVIPPPRPYGRYGIFAREIEASLPEAAAAWIHWLVNESGWQVEDPATKEAVAIRPRHIVLLFRRFAASWGRDAAQPYVRALEDRGVPHLLVGDRSFFARAEIETLRAALTAIEWPDDELSMFATLRGALFAIPDALLLRFRLEIGKLDPFGKWARADSGQSPTPTDDSPATAPVTSGVDAAEGQPSESQRSKDARSDDAAETFGPIREALVLLGRLHEQRNRVGVADTIGSLLTATRAHAGLALRPAGNQVLANVQRIIDMARAFEMRGGLSFRGFVERLADAAEAPGAAPTPPLVEEGADGVRLMTVHAAKGLEFPVVVLADMTTRLTRGEPSHYSDPERGLFAQRLLQLAPWELLENAEIEQARDAAEGVRLAYVAATRARDLLAVPAVGDGPYEGGWLGALDRVVFPSKAEARAIEPGIGCPAFGTRTVLERPQQFDGAGEGSVQPGQYRTAPDVTAVWWDPALLERSPGRRRGLHHESLLAEGPASDAAAQRYDAWQAAQDDARVIGVEPSVRVQTVSQAPEPAQLSDAEITVETVERTPGRPGGKRFGTLVHAILRDTGFDPQVDGATDAIADLARLHGRILQAPMREVDAAVDAVAAALEHPVLRQASQASVVHREAPFLIDVDGTMVEGVIDLAFRDPASDGWVVVDFKTDAQTEDLEKNYRRQLAWYLTAVERLTGQTARGVLLAI